MPNKVLFDAISDNILFCGYANTALETWERIKTECDVVILPYSFDLQFKKLYETHFPSKLCEYLSLGMPVIIAGPSYATGVIWGLKNPKSVITTTDKSLQHLQQQIQQLTQSIDFRNEYSSNTRLLLKEFSTQNIKSKFYSLLQSHYIKKT